MAARELVFFKNDDGTIPFLEWFECLAPKVRDKCRLRLERLQELGHELRRPEADLLRDGIYELRIGFRGINYRVLYFFHKTEPVVASHGIQKEQRVPDKEIEKAIRRKNSFEVNPAKYSFYLGDKL